MAASHVASAIQNGNSWTGGTTSITYPGTIQSGDMLIITAVGRDNGVLDGWTTLPAGFADIVPDGGDDIARAAYKVADGTESGSFSVLVSNSSTPLSVAYSLMVIRGADSPDTCIVNTSHSLTISASGPGMLICVNTVDSPSTPTVSSSDLGAMSVGATKGVFDADDGSADINIRTFYESRTTSATPTLTSNVNVSRDGIIALFLPEASEELPRVTGYTCKEQVFSTGSEVGLDLPTHASGELLWFTYIGIDDNNLSLASISPGWNEVEVTGSYLGGFAWCIGQGPEQTGVYFNIGGTTNYVWACCNSIADYDYNDGVPYNQVSYGSGDTQQTLNFSNSPSEDKLGLMFFGVSGTVDYVLDRDELFLTPYASSDATLDNDIVPFFAYSGDYLSSTNYDTTIAAGAPMDDGGP